MDSLCRLYRAVLGSGSLSGCGNGVTVQQKPFLMTSLAAAIGDGAMVMNRIDVGFRFLYSNPDYRQTLETSRVVSLKKDAQQIMLFQFLSGVSF